MMTFNSQICTSREQSERLLALGLKKETADMSIISKYLGCDDDGVLIYEENIYTYPPSNEKICPAWSLHRLMILATSNRKVMLMRYDFDIFDYLIRRIEYAIQEGYFKEYLEE